MLFQPAAGIRSVKQRAELRGKGGAGHPELNSRRLPFASCSRRGSNTATSSYGLRADAKITALRLAGAVFQQLPGTFLPARLQEFKKKIPLKKEQTLAVVKLLSGQQQFLKIKAMFTSLSGVKENLVIKTALCLPSF